MPMALRLRTQTWGRGGNQRKEEKTGKERDGHRLLQVLGGVQAEWKAVRAPERR